jgi:hypothetical protein
MHDSHSIAVKYLLNTSYADDAWLHELYVSVGPAMWRVLRVALQQLKAFERAGFV